jgi:putative ABC transport system permease protein
MRFRSLELTGVRQLGTRRLRSALTTLGIVLGVGMVFGVLVLVGTIRHTFDSLIDSAWGSADLIVTAQAGGQLPQSAYPYVQSTPGVDHAAAMVGGAWVRLDPRGRPIRGAKGLMWVAAFDPRDNPYDMNVISGRMQRSGDEIVLEQQWASDHGLHVGQRVPVATATGRARMYVVGIFAFRNNASFGGQGLAGVPLETGRRLMHRPTGWDQITVQAVDRERIGPLKAQLRRELGPSAKVQQPSALGDEIGQQMKALNVVLYFFSGVALFVGAFLILNSFNMTVLQRVRELGTLRTLGATRGAIVRLVLVEALVLGVIGTALGIALGLLLAQGLIAAMRGLGLPIGGLSVGAFPVIAAVVVGVLVTLAGAIWPARRAGRVEPIRAVIGGRALSERPSRRRGLVGLALFLPGAILGGHFWFGGGSDTSGTLGTIAGMAMTMAMFAGLVMTAPWTVIPILRAMAWPLRRLSPTGGRLAVDSVAGNPGRTAATAAALTVGLSVFVVNSVFSASFLGTIRDQVNRNFARDVTVQQIGGGLQTGESYPIPPSVQREVAALPGAGVVTPVQSRFVKLPGTKGTAADGLAIGVDPARYGEVDRTAVRGATRQEALAGLARGGVLVVPAYAKKVGLGVGDRITIHGATGNLRPRIVGELQSLTSGMPEIQMSSATMRRAYGPTDAVQLAVRARARAQAEPLRRRIQALLDRRHPNLEVLSTTQVRKQIDKQINQQFALFDGILAIAVIVSLLGVINTLAMSVVERTREIGVLRALGSSRTLVRVSLLDESLLLTSAGAVVGVLSGLLIGVAWMQGLGEQLPGLSFHFPLAETIAVAILAVVLGTLAAILPARRAAHVDVIQALTYE